MFESTRTAIKRSYMSPSVGGMVRPTVREDRALTVVGKLIADVRVYTSLSHCAAGLIVKVPPWS